MISEKSLGQIAFFWGGERVNNSEPLGGLGENRGLTEVWTPSSDNYVFEITVGYQSMTGQK